VTALQLSVTGYFEVSLSLVCRRLAVDWEPVPLPPSFMGALHMNSSPELRKEAWRYIEAITNSMSKEESRQLMARAFELAQMAAEIEAPKIDPRPSKGQGREIET
jgi:hypothetical protein